MLRPIVVLLALISCGEAASAKDPATKKRVRALVAQLVSPNEAPTYSGPKAVYPEGFDKDADEVAYRAYAKLCDLGPPAFPHLFEHFQDQRYSLTASTGEAYRNYTVGRLCFAVMDLQMQPYGTHAAGEGDPRSRHRRPDYTDHFNLRDPKAARRWWKSHKDMSLRELQIEVLEWIQEKEAENRELYLDAERQFVAETLNALRKSNRPLRRGRAWAP